MFPLVGRTGSPLTRGSDFETVFDSFFPRFFRIGTPTNFYPDVDIIEGDKELRLRADIPGIDKDQIKITVEGDLLTISGERQDEKKEEAKGFVRFERCSGRFERSFRLPDWAKTDDIKADYKNGVLELVIPKTEKALPKEITVSVK